MSIDIKWEPLSIGGYVSTSRPLAFRQVLESAFGNMPFTIGNIDIHMLTVLAVAWENNENDAEPSEFRMLIELIEKHGTIRIDYE